MAGQPPAPQQTQQPRLWATRKQEAGANMSLEMLSPALDGGGDEVEPWGSVR